MTTQIAKLENYIIDEFDGFTSHEIRGGWKENGRIYYDESVQYTIATTSLTSIQSLNLLNIILDDFNQISAAYGVGTDLYFTDDKRLNSSENWIKEFNEVA